MGAQVGTDGGRAISVRMRQPRWRRTALVGLLGGIVLASTSLVLGAGPAVAGVILSAGPNWPDPVVVGQTGLPGTLTLTNNSDGGEAVGNLTMDQITLVPSCGVIDAINCPAAAVDPGVFRLSTIGIGSETPCAGITFTITEIDPTQGKLLFTPNGGAKVVLGPSGGGNNRCRINFTIDVLKEPAKDGNPSKPGVQTVQIGGAHATHDTELQGTGTGTDDTTVAPATPTMVTQVAPATVGVGETFTDKATVTGVPAGPSPTGSVIFTVFQDGPGAAPCSGQSQTLGPVALVATAGSSPPAATATSPVVTATTAGTYRFKARYGGDQNYVALPDSACNDTNENVTSRLMPSIVTQVAPVSVGVGQTAADTATVTGTAGGPVPTGTVTFTAYLDAPGAAPCSGPAQTLGPVALVAGPAAGPPTATAGSGPVTATAPGTYRFRAAYSGDGAYAALPITACALANENVTVTKAAPRIVTTASEQVVVGGSIRDTATISGGAAPTGTVTFAVFGPDNATCSGTPASSSSKAVNGNGPYSSDPFTPTAAGRYRFVATYGGDANNAAAGPTACDDAAEAVEVVAVATTTTTTPAVSATTTTTTPVLGTLVTLPRTGIAAAGLSLVAVTVIGLGGALTVVTWRRRSAGAGPPADG